MEAAEGEDPVPEEKLLAKRKGQKEVRSRTSGCLSFRLPRAAMASAEPLGGRLQAAARPLPDPEEVEVH